jgi:hypothetical protein
VGKGERQVDRRTATHRRKGMIRSKHMEKLFEENRKMGVLRTKGRIECMENKEK